MSTSGIGSRIARARASRGADVVLDGFGDADEIEMPRAGFAARVGVRASHGADLSRPGQIAEGPPSAAGGDPPGPPPHAPPPCLDSSAATRRNDPEWRNTTMTPCRKPLPDRPRKQPRKNGFLAAVLVCGGAVPTAADCATIGYQAVIQGVTVVDTATGGLRPDVSIVVEDGKIAKIAPAGDPAVSGSANVIDGRGKFVVPGYLDMHTHALTAGDPQKNFEVMLANGITGFRQMIGTLELLARRRAGEDLTPGAAPDLLQLPGTILSGANARSPADVAALVGEQQAQGADFIKIVGASPASYVATLREAQAVGLTVAGHLPPTVPVEVAAAEGMRAIEHLGPREGLLLSASTDEAALRQQIANTPPPSPPLVPPTPETVARNLANPILDTPPDQLARMARAAQTYDPAKAEALAQLLVADDLWQVPTLIRLKTFEFGDSESYRNDPNLAYVTQEERDLWQSTADAFAASVSSQTRADLAALFDVQLKVTKLFADQGVPMLAGSDYGGQWLVPGFSLHQEFDSLGEAGLSPLQILQMTTLNGAKFLGLEDEMGSVSEGKLADLVLLDANPLTDVQNLHGIHGVVKGGTYYSFADLRALLGTGGGSTPSPVPVPASFWLLLSGLGATAAAGAVGRCGPGAVAR